MIDRLAPKPPEQGYTRVAVAQLHFNPAAVISEHSFLTQPFGLNEELLWGRVPPKPNFREIAQRRKALGVQMRALYCEQITAKLATIARHCERWHCNLLVFPEYSVPPESIAAVLEASGGMTTVLGTHYVETPRARSTFYSDLGLSATPAPGHAIALVSSNRVVVGSQLKMQRSRWEQDIRVSQDWAPIQLATLGNRTLGVLICIDFLNERDEAFAQVVRPKLKETSVLAVPSLTSRASRSDFDPKLRSEAQRHGRPVAYANTASGGGTTIYIENANTQTPFPQGVPVLEYGQEGVVVVDIDLDLNRPRDSRAARFDHRPVARSVAASQLIYLGDDVGSEYHACLSDVLADTELNQLADAVKTHSERLNKSAAIVGRHTTGRIIDLIDRVDDIDDSERILCRLREVFMPREVLSPAALRALMLQGAERETSQWNGDPEVAKVVAEWRGQLQAARNEDL
jgi:predicted amidohydrolase